MIVRSALPDTRLAGIVRYYRSREANLGGDTVRVALPARTDVLVEFYFTAPHRLELQADGRLENAPWIAAVGAQTHRRVDLLLQGRLDVFTIHFTPTGIHALVGIPMSALTDDGIDASGLFGDRAMRWLHERLAAGCDLAARARIADAFLLGLLHNRPKAYESRIVADGLAAILRTRGSADGHSYALASGASDRHFRRLFEQEVGMAPKLYARIVRLEAALREREKAPARTWADIAHGCGWFDEAHMDKDFRALAGIAPIDYRPRPG